MKLGEIGDCCEHFSSALPLFQRKAMNTKHSHIRVLVVDDSAFMRKTLSTMLKKCPGVQVVGTAQNGSEAIEQVKRCQPDVMTLDIDMPGMNGLEVLDYVMAHHPIPVIMISALTKEGAGATLQALERGAVDFIPKEGAHEYWDIGRIQEQLGGKVQDAYQARRGMHQSRSAAGLLTSSLSDRDYQEKGKAVASSLCHRTSLGRENQPVISSAYDMFPVVVVGSSTGGPNLLKHLVQSLSVPFRAALIIIQHMPKFFTKVFAETLNAISSFPISEAHQGDWLEAGNGYVAPGDQHLFIERQADGRATIKISPEPRHLAYRPSVDCAMVSAAEHFGPSVIGVVVSGMGDDGVEGSQKIKAYGGTVLVQDETTALMYGMPRAVVEAGWADVVLSDVQLAACMNQIVETKWEEGRNHPGRYRPSQGRNGLD